MARQEGRKPWPPRVPTVLVVIAAVALLASSVIMFAGGQLGGITWDENVHGVFLQTYFDHGWNVSPEGIVNGLPDPQKIWGIYVYGPVAGLLAHSLDVVTGAEQWGQLASTATAYAGRHVASGIFALIGVGAVALTIRLIVRSWRWALLGATLLGSLPLWVGHGMFNIKDTPVAAGYALATAGIVALATPGATPSTRRRRIVIAWIALVAGSVLAAGTRAATGVAIAAGIIALSFALLVAPKSAQIARSVTRWRPALRVLLHGGGALALSYLILLGIYPNVYRNPVLLAYESLYVSAKFPFPETVMTNGEWMTQPVSWTYLPLWFGAQIPVMVLAAAIGFGLWWLVGVVAIYRGHASRPRVAICLPVVPVIAQAVALPLGAVAAQSNIYNGTRQFLFVLPALAILATLGIMLAMRVIKRNVWRGWLRNGAWGLVALGVLVPVLAQVRLFPYSYAFYNLPTAIAGVDGRWPTDYWRQSARELVQRLPAEGTESCAYEQYRKDELYSCLAESPFRPFVSERGQSALPAAPAPGTYWYLRENQGWVDLPGGCEIFDQISRPLFLSEITIAQIAQCDSNQISKTFTSPAE